MKLPKVVVSSVVRSAFQGESHGGIYLVDLQLGATQQVVDWNDPAISWEGRGADRGLRGIDFVGDKVICAASDEVFFYDRDFKLAESLRNPYLKHCHEIHVSGDRLFLTSTAFDSILEVDLKSGAFVRGYCLRAKRPSPIARRLQLRRKVDLLVFDPNASHGPTPRDTIHLNSVWIHDGVLLACGTGLNEIVAIDEFALRTFAKVRFGTHNARPFQTGVIANHTRQNHIAYMGRQGRILKSFPVKMYDTTALLNADLPTDHARQGFARGLCVWKDRFLIGGSSPSTVSVFDFESEEPVASLTLTMDMRNSVHGLQVWPF